MEELMLSGAWLAAIGLWSVSLVVPAVASVSRYGKFNGDQKDKTFFSWSISRAKGFRLMYLIAMAWCASLWYIEWKRRGISLHMLLISLHVVQRAAECIWTHRSSNATMTLPGWVLGLGFYAVVPLNDVFVVPWIWSPAVSFAVAFLFVLCCYRQHCCHVVLAQLRGSTKGDACVQQYGVPPLSGEFRFTWTPHYAYECMLYLLLCIASGATWPSLLCASFVIANQTQLMWQTRLWYRAFIGK